MIEDARLSRRRFIKSAVVGSAIAGVVHSGTRLAQADETAGRAGPLKIGIRAASMKMVGDPDVIRTAAGIPGIRGVELQTTAGKENLRDPDAVRRYEKEAERWGIEIPSLAGIWDRGVQIHSPEAGRSIERSIRAAETLGAGVILVAFFRQNAPDMNDATSYGPIVDVLANSAKTAAEAGVTLGLENSLSPADNKKLVDLVDHASVRVYYDMHNMAHYGHQEEAIPGVKLLGRERICMVHVKNGAMLLEEPGMIDWVRALAALDEVGYDGWYVYETGHDDVEDCIEDTKRNNRFLERHVRPRPSP